MIPEHLLIRLGVLESMAEMTLREIGTLREHLDGHFTQEVATTVPLNKARPARLTQKELQDKADAEAGRKAVQSFVDQHRME
jgi:hypothetical protein